MDPALRNRLKEFALPVRPSDLAITALVGLVALVAVAASLAVIGFEHAVEWLFHTGYETLPSFLMRLGLPAWSAYFIYPVLLGLVVVGAKRQVAPQDRHHSIPYVIVSMIKRDGVIRPLSTLWKTVGAIITLGAGGSLGREGPVTLLGGGIGSGVGQLFRLTPEWRNTLIAAGAGAAVATAFHAPITGAVFVMEIVLIRIEARAFAWVSLACVVAAQTANFLDQAPILPIPAYGLQSPWEIPLYILLGLLMAPLARIYINVLHRSEKLGQRLAKIPAWAKPALGGLLFGAVAIFFPRTLGGGFGSIAEALSGSLSLQLMAGLVLAKLVTIGLTAGSGWPGGVFTPALFLGAMAGGTFGTAAHLLLPNVVVHPGAYAVVGMSAMIAGATQAPLTALTLIFELTRDYAIALPAMVAIGIAAVFSQRFSPFSVDTLHLPELGVLLPWQIQDLRSVALDQVMVRDVHTVQADMDLKDVIGVMQRSRHGGYPVVDASKRLVGMITLRDVRDVPVEHRLTTPVRAVMNAQLITLAPSATLAEAAMLMAQHGVGRILVVDNGNPERLVGLVSRSDILRSYPQHEPHGA